MEHKWLKVLVHASTWFAPILLPLVVYVIISDREVKSLSLQALVFHIVISVLISISLFFSWVIIGIPFLIVFGLIAIIAPVIGIVKAWNGSHFRYPIIGFLFR